VIATSIGLLALAPAMANGKPTASRIVVNCYQNETTLVWGEVGPVTDSFKLGGDSSPWLDNQGGPASCYADLEDPDVARPQHAAVGRAGRHGVRRHGISRQADQQ
jgi:hypothetical protein